jgi:hypothetical protein
MTKAELIAALSAYPNETPVFIVPNPPGTNAALMMDDVPGTAYDATLTDHRVARYCDTTGFFTGTFVALSPIVR